MQMKKKLKLLGLGILGLAAAVVPASVLVSCSDSSPSTPTGGEVVKKSFSAVVENPTAKSGGSITYVTNANENENARAEAQKIFKGFQLSQVANDFRLAIRDIYDAYEFENANLEAEIQSMTVEKYDNEQMQATLRIVYEVETDNKRDSEQYVTQYRTFDLKEMFSTKEEIANLKTTLKAGKDNNSIDGEELWEFYFGENDYDNDWDDIGIFDKLRRLQKDVSANGVMLGYKIDLFALTPIIEGNKIIEIPKDAPRGKDPAQKQTKELFVPSMSTNYFFYATIEDNLPFVIGTGNQKLNIALDPTKLNLITKQEFTTYINEASIGNFTNYDGLLKNIPNSISVSNDKIAKDGFSIKTSVDSSLQNYTAVQYTFKDDNVKFGSQIITTIKYLVNNDDFKKA